MKPCSHIDLVSRDLSVRFEWSGYDGDDEFDHLYLDVLSEGGTKRFDFGPCDTLAVDRLAQFFRRTSPGDIAGGGRYPIVRSYAVYRDGSAYRVVVHFKSPEVREEFYLRSPTVEFGE